MTKPALSLGLATFLLCAPAARAQGSPPTLDAAPLSRLGEHDSRRCLGSPLADVQLRPSGPVIVELMTTEQEELAAAQAMRAWMRSLGAGLLALLAVALAAVGLARLGQLRRPLAATVLARRPVPAAVVLSLLSPVLPPLVLLHAERQLLPSPVLLLAAVGAALSLSMLLARRRLALQLRRAVGDPGRAAAGGSRLGAVDDGTLVAAEVAPQKLVPPPGARGRIAWFSADLGVTLAAGGEAARVALAQADVDDGAARLLARLANGLPLGDERLTVLGAAVRVPADADAVDPLCRAAPTQARIGAGALGRALVVAGSPAALARRLRLECLLLALVYVVNLGAVGLAFFG